MRCHFPPQIHQLGHQGDLPRCYVRYLTTYCITSHWIPHLPHELCTCDSLLSYVHNFVWSLLTSYPYLALLPFLYRITFYPLPLPHFSHHPSPYPLPRPIGLLRECPSSWWPLWSRCSGSAVSSSLASSTASTSRVQEHSQSPTRTSLLLSVIVWYLMVFGYIASVYNVLVFRYCMSCGYYVLIWLISMPMSMTSTSAPPHRPYTSTLTLLLPLSQILP